MSFLNSDQINSLTGALYTHFQTFSGSPITVWKEPIQVLTNASLPVYAGFGAESVEAQYEYQRVSGVFPARVIQGTDNETVKVRELHFNLPKNGIQIKVQEAAKNFIENGKNELIQVNNFDYNIVSYVGVQNYLGLKFYVYNLERTT